MCAVYVCMCDVVHVCGVSIVMCVGIFMVCVTCGVFNMVHVCVQFV